jgi:hypothetical protein
LHGVWCKKGRFARCRLRRWCGTAGARRHFRSSAARGCVGGNCAFWPKAGSWLDGDALSRRTYGCPWWRVRRSSGVARRTASGSQSGSSWSNGRGVATCSRSVRCRGRRRSTRQPCEKRAVG